ncbi:nuclear transport factor 2 family protein [Streptomyces mobaraensis NBRC 13819 = DSM 40847]|uniref:Limonene-1,2-epoxide hydrolase n=1 Tax=Streptomyces mobaraensis (strain ATCC 29032 / DSM 40847 / JCM 4168 / NBRC 13819 / NCIMB 11159 / IPCR 16-22) TaxID=1223523 RepID=M3C6A8_STRM1|nr:nuclear transport factor 2 family protein [Streptomyces mobaraensis]EME99446.1 limonene-1,2-epoxide hydrolase [Streptomyces mobaraensis NBRC 13819 = DSM 40847]QTT73047.1 nuclear transport factor 2 family protein [Streptomyces mobaraensis NBRC 13819 = DSM 40847]
MTSVKPLTPVTPVTSMTETGTGPEDVVARFFAAWDGLDPARLASFFAEDGTYHSMPLPPVVGRDRIHAYFTDFLARFTAADFTVHHQASSATEGGGVVFNERTDEMRLRSGAVVRVRVAGVFEIRDGLIAAWRDYFDLGATRGEG